MHQRSRLAASDDSTYHSFNDIELFEPPSPPKHHHSHPHHHHHLPPVNDENPPPSPVKMQRQDSGYESFAPSPRNSISYSRRPSVSRRISNASASGSSTGPGASPRTRTRPSTRRSATSKSYSTGTSTANANANASNSQSLYLVRSNMHNNMQHPQISYFHFPSPEPIVVPESDAARPGPSAIPSPPPQTTHYWTSDDTRRIEYAAIDAASRGVKGWIRRRLVPDCFVSDESRHVSFDDDSGSVRRYRLELEDEPVHEKIPRTGRFRRLIFWLRRANSY
ncbi:hypothetical protein B0I35DRAFT_412512 [Stachybotrys elegans]|uniref:Uncharacterized protein n=1 Tax=Stachybotrys elegans TaxID=80388 RepID=A0A8K0SJA6_9HYPO|nr:hypothetical protein B0I35DRAFT_412512 [Stachybotrys elegans]